MTKLTITDVEKRLDYLDTIEDSARTEALILIARLLVMLVKLEGRKK